MKKFTFPLERVREWREKQITVEQARLERLLSEKSLIECRRDTLERESRENAAAIAHSASVTSEQLEALDTFHRYVVSQRGVIAPMLADYERRISEQRTRLMEARRRFELLDKLREKKWNLWSADLSREIDAAASEAFLAKRR